MTEQTTTNNLTASGRGGPELFKALAQFQATGPKAKMDAVNPHFKSKYATLASVLEAARPMTEFGLSVPQLVEGDVVVTMLCHSSGEYLSTVTRIVITKDNAHGYGAGVTYARRYALSAILGICNEEDDDANGAITRRRKSEHSEDFKNGKTKHQFPRLKELKLDREVVDQYVQHVYRNKETGKTKRLSMLNKREVDLLLDGLSKADSPVRQRYNEWEASRG